MGEPPRVSVVMTARDAGATIDETVAAVLSQGYPDLELVVAEGLSADDTRDRLAAAAARDARVRLVDNPEGHTPAGLNAAIAASGGEVIVRCDAHSRLPEGYVQAVVDLLTQTGAAVVGGVQAPRGRSAFGRAVAAAMRSRLGSGSARYRTGRRSGATDTVYLGAFRRDALEAAGGFDERMLRNQDYDLNHRIRRRGGTVWLDTDLRVGYRPRETPGALWRQYFAYGRWKRAGLRLHPAAARLRQAAPPLFVLAVASAAVVAARGSPVALLALTAAYGVSLAAAAAAALVRTRDAAVLLMPVALAVMHLAWGIGFLVGVPASRLRG
jgi:succinoglycan biosynthesis protein ExoA